MIAKSPRAALAATLLAACGLAAAADDTSKIRTHSQWVRGQQMPLEDLKNYPCHIAELPCSKYPPPKVEKVKFTGSLGDKERGKKIALDLRWGNCIACHNLPGGLEGGNIGPSLADYAKRNMPHDYTYQRIWDNRVFNPNAFMPLYGPNKVLDEQEIRDVMAFLLSGG